MKEIVKHINDTNASYRSPNAGDAKNTDLFLDSEHYELFKDSGDKITVRFSKDNLSKAILFIASILPRKYDNSTDHRKVNYSASFVYEQLAMLDAFFIENGSPVEFKTQIWTPRKNIVKKNGEIDTRFYFNGLLETFTYVTQSGEIVKTKFSIRNYLAGGYSNLHILKSDDGIFDVFITNTQIPTKDSASLDVPLLKLDYLKLPLQQIAYGAPGTGKSFCVDKDVEKYHMKAIRTTFHPDSDYSTFVGAYKPKMERVKDGEKQIILDYSTMVDKFKEYLDAKPVNITKACTLFGYDFHDSIVNMDNYGKTIVDLVSDAYKSGTTYDTQVRAGMSVYEQNAPIGKTEKKIVYTYSKQAFLKAYIAAWKDLKNPYVLVIEEINRGNCAQIFGDLFQLLDRNDAGFSSYPISADSDLADALFEELDGLQIDCAEEIDSLYTDTVMEDVLLGNKLILPNNLYIWATMNTSDQSLFPIDSAFKRRWEWKYVPISDAGKSWAISINGVRYDWWSFIENINKKIGDTILSEDKKLGYFFCKANLHDNIITADRFVGKVLFYIYNDVFKDYGFDDPIFKDPNDKENPDLLFKDFFLPNGTPREEKIQVFLNNLNVKTVEEASESIEENVNAKETKNLEEESKIQDLSREKDSAELYGLPTITYTFDGETELSEPELGIKVITKYINENPDLPFNQLKELFPDSMIGEDYKLLGLLVPEKILRNADYETQKKIYGAFSKDRKYESRDGIVFFINTNWCSANIQNIVDFANQQGWNISRKD